MERKGACCLRTYKILWEEKTTKELRAPNSRTRQWLGEDPEMATVGRDSVKLYLTDADVGPKSRNVGEAGLGAETYNHSHSRGV